MIDLDAIEARLKAPIDIGRADIERLRRQRHADARALVVEVYELRQRAAKRMDIILGLQEERDAAEAKLAQIAEAVDNADVLWLRQNVRRILADAS